MKRKNWTREGGLIRTGLVPRFCGSWARDRSSRTPQWASCMVTHPVYSLWNTCSRSWQQWSAASAASQLHPSVHCSPKQQLAQSRRESSGKHTQLPNSSPDLPSTGVESLLSRWLAFPSWRVDEHNIVYSWPEPCVILWAIERFWRHNGAK